MKNEKVNRSLPAAIFAAVMCILLLSTSASAIGPEKARELLELAVESMGGAERASGWKTRVDKGIMNQFQPGWGSLKADNTRHVKKPDKVREERDFSAYDHPFFYHYYLNGDDAWYMVNMNARRHPIVTEAMKNLARTIDGLAYYTEQCDTFFTVAEVPDDSLFTGASLERIGVVDEGDTIIFDLNKESHLPVRSIDKGGTRHIIMGDYRETGGMIVPFHVEVFEPQTGVTTEYLWKEILFDVEIDDSIFEEYRPPKGE
jgi:hypothetical protein